MLPTEFGPPVQVEWPEDKTRIMRLLRDFWFVDGNGKMWTAPEGSVIDGASIPRFFWRAVGGPFSGRYREPSVIHDVYCVTRTESHEDVHRMFHEAMLCNGVGEKKAWSMYKGVRWFGPKW
jgi:hypothetical protein